MKRSSGDGGSAPTAFWVGFAVLALVAIYLVLSPVGYMALRTVGVIR